MTQPQLIKIDQDIAKLWAFLAVSSDAPEKSDAIFVFGGLDLAVPRHAAHLYAEGLAPRVLVTGNAGALTRETFKEPEAIVFKNEMLANGVPEADIAIETSATNTQENVLKGVEQLQTIDKNIKRLILVAKPFLMRRCLATFAKNAPSFSLICSAPPGDWKDSIDRPEFEFVSRLIAEFQRLVDYPQQGFIDPVAIPDDVQASVDLVRSAIMKEP